MNSVVKLRLAGVLMTVLSIRYIIWVVQSLNTKALYLSIPFLLVSVYLAFLLTVTFVNNWSREHIQHKKIDWLNEPKIWTIIPTFGETPEMLEQTVRSWIDQDYPIAYRRLVVSSQTPGDEISKLVKRLNDEVIQKQSLEIEERLSAIAQMSDDWCKYVDRLDALYLDLSLYKSRRSRESSMQRLAIHGEIQEIEGNIFGLLGMQLDSIIDDKGRLTCGHIERLETISNALETYWGDIRQSSEQHVRSLVDKKSGWLPVIHYSQPDKETNSKALNLNSALQYIYSLDPNVTYVETRDADDLAPEDFLSIAVGTLIDHPEASFVQSKKLTIGTGEHPLEPDEPVFFEKIMPAKNSKKAVFPCGSGLVWKLSDLAEIGEFPNWNLVEDLYSGFLAWQKGKHGIYIDIVGAIGQVVPEDIPNIYKQRGTWALDTMRLFFWHSKRGLTFWQRLQFAEIGLFYLLSFPVLYLVMVPITSLVIGIHPLISDHLQYALHFWPFAASVELFLVTMADGIPYERIWKSRQTWFGLAPVYAKACILALMYGPKRKPNYKVTRKYHQFSFYWRQTIVQWSLAFATVFAIVFHLMSKKLVAEADLGSILYAVFYLFVLSGILRTSWYGVFKRVVMRKTA